MILNTRYSQRRKCHFWNLSIMYFRFGHFCGLKLTVQKLLHLGNTESLDRCGGTQQCRQSAMQVPGKCF